MILGIVLAGFAGLPFTFGAAYTLVATDSVIPTLMWLFIGLIWVAIYAAIFFEQLYEFDPGQNHLVKIRSIGSFCISERHWELSDFDRVAYYRSSRPGRDSVSTNYILVLRHKMHEEQDLVNFARTNKRDDALDFGDRLAEFLGQQFEGEMPELMTQHW